MYFAKYNAHTAIVVCGNMKLALKGQDKDLWICDCSAAIENMLLAATDLGRTDPCRSKRKYEGGK